MTVTINHVANAMLSKKEIACFYRCIGVKEKSTYDNELKGLYEKLIELEGKNIVFDNEIELSGEMELISYIYNELQSMDIQSLKNQEITIFDSHEVNELFLEGLQYVVNLAIKKENFFSDNTRNNFITKLIVWAYTYVRDLIFDNELSPKCLYYGDITRHEVYFLILLRMMNIDVVYLNPLKEEYFDEIDEDRLTVLVKALEIDNVGTLKARCERGVISNNVETVTKKIQSEIHEELFVDTGMFKPWQFRGGFNKSVLLDTILEDIYIYYNEPAKLREGFSVVDNKVKVPCFFKKIDGQHLDICEYKKLVEYCVESAPGTVFINSGNISMDVDTQGNVYELMFCQLSDGTFNIEEVKKSKLYKFSRYSNETQNFLLEKFNELILRTDIYVKPLGKEDVLKLLSLVLSLNEEIVKIIDNFDFADKVPKLVIYLDGEDVIEESMLMLLGYIHNVGVDVAIFNPSGLCNIANVINEERFNLVRLQNVKYDSRYKDLKNYVIPKNRKSENQKVVSRLFGSKLFR